MRREPKRTIASATSGKDARADDQPYQLDPYKFSRTGKRRLMRYTHPAPPALSTIVTDSAGFVYQTVDGMLKNIAPDIPLEEARVLAATQGRLAGKAFGQTVAVAA